MQLKSLKLSTCDMGGIIFLSSLPLLTVLELDCHGDVSLAPVGSCVSLTHLRMVFRGPNVVPNCGPLNSCGLLQFASLVWLGGKQLVWLLMICVLCPGARRWQRSLLLSRATLFLHC